MLAKLLAILSSIIILASSESSILSQSEYNMQVEKSQLSELPEALSDDDSFNELPFEQLRQALREEVERNPKKDFQHSSSEKYNLFIR